MWGSLLALALLTTISPIRLSLILLVLSRPRPMQNLFAYWVGAVIIGLGTLLGALIALYATPASASFVRSFAHPSANSTAHRVALGLGIALLALSALMAASALVKRTRKKELLLEGAGGSAPERTDDDESDGTSLALKSSLLSRLLYPDHNDDDPDADTTRGLFTHTRRAWRNGSPWISFVIGLIFVPPLDGVLFALAIIVASGAAMGVQFAAVVAFMFGVLLLEEAILLSNWIVPTNTQATLQRVHDWARVHQQAFVAAILAVVGTSLVVRSMGGL